MALTEGIDGETLAWREVEHLPLQGEVVARFRAAHDALVGWADDLDAEIVELVRIVAVLWHGRLIDTGDRPHTAKQTMLPLSAPVVVPKFVRAVSSSPYGRTHVWRRRRPTLPNPVVPKYPQLVIRADGTSFTHWTTSPRSRIRLTRDTTNNPVWNTHLWLRDSTLEDEANLTGRMGRFRRRFEGLGSAASSIEESD